MEEEGWLEPPSPSSSSELPPEDCESGSAAEAKSGEPTMVWRRLFFGLGGREGRGGEGGREEGREGGGEGGREGGRGGEGSGGEGGREEGREGREGRKVYREGLNR